MSTSANYDETESLGPADAGGVVIRYMGGEDMKGLPSRHDLIVKNGANLHFKVKTILGNNNPVCFMPNAVEEYNDYSHGGSGTYTMRIHGVTMDGSKTAVLLTGIPVYFDVLVPDLPVEATAEEKQNHLRVFEDRIYSIFDADMNEISIKRIKTVSAYSTDGYSKDMKKFKRVFTHNVQNRKHAINACVSANLTLASDDRTSYYRKAARENNLPLSSWVVLNGYVHVEGPDKKLPLTKHIIRLDYGGYKPFVDPYGEVANRERCIKAVSETNLLAKDRTLVLTWDIETRSRDTIDLPRGEVEGDNVFMICMTVHWKDDPVPIQRICIVDVETAPDPAWTTIICGSYVNILKAFAICWRAIAPDICVGFNDSNYDWKFVVEKARMLKLVSWMWTRMSAVTKYKSTDNSVLEWNYIEDAGIKIAADETFESTYLKVPGCIMMDARVCFKKLYPKGDVMAAGSLKFYLKISGLSGKADMPYKHMWECYDEALRVRSGKITGPEATAAAEKMRHVAHYCVIDALRCQQLMVKRNVYNDNREVSSIAYVTLSDTYYFAGGMRVRNLLAHTAFRRNMLTSMVSKGKKRGGKYTGAIVLNPKKGLSPNANRVKTIDAIAAQLRQAEAKLDTDTVAELRQELRGALKAFAVDRPVAGLDFASLYPSIIMAYNLSPEKLIRDPLLASAMKSQGTDLHNIDFDFTGRRIVGWTIRHGDDMEKMGYFPRTLLDLFNRRAKEKKILAKHGAITELIDLINTRATKTNMRVADATAAIIQESIIERDQTAALLAPGADTPKLSPGATLAEELAGLNRTLKLAQKRIDGITRIYELADAKLDADGKPADRDDCIEQYITSEYERASFAWTCVNSKQMAIKVYMNTFYGEAGNSISSLYKLEIAGGVTSMGQYNIKAVAAFVQDKGYGIKYGDTDSLYIYAPPRYFKDCDEDYVMGRIDREEWYAAMVRITMRALGQIRDEVNDYLRADNGTGYLRMAYEEVLFPVVFTGKKKYFGIPHEHEVNFHPKKLFIKGIDVVKQGQTKLAIEIGHRIMWKCVSLQNTSSVCDIVKGVLREAIENPKQWNFQHFIKSAAWKPNKQNIPVQKFIARMKKRHAEEVIDATRCIEAGEAPDDYIYNIPDPGDRFQFVLVKTGAQYDLRGRKKKLANSDRMEFTTVAQALGKDVDVAIYMSKYVVGLCARFINGSAEFQPPTPMEPSETDKYAQKAAGKMLDAFVNTINGCDAEMLRRRGVAYRRAYKTATTVAYDSLVSTSGPEVAEVLNGEWLDFELFGQQDEGGQIMVSNPTRIVESAWDRAKLLAEQVVSETYDQWFVDYAECLGIAADGSDIVQPSNSKKKTTTVLYSILSGAGKRQPAGFVAGLTPTDVTKCELSTQQQLAKLAKSTTRPARIYGEYITDIVLAQRIDEHIRLGENIGLIDGEKPTIAPITLLPCEIESLTEFHAVWYDAVGIALTKLRDAAFIKYLTRIKSKRVGNVGAPSAREQAELVDAMVGRITIDTSL